MDRRIALQRIVLLLGVLVVTSLAAEAALRLGVGYFANPARLFRYDLQAGWRNAPYIVKTMTNAAGEVWHVRTDENGHRLIPRDPNASRRILILGDSLAFGEGIEVEDRFDVRMLTDLPSTHFINTGTMGYGTDQEYAAFQRWKTYLKAGDTILILLNRSDYADVLRRRYIGRAKPFVEKQQGLLVFNAPSVALLERWSDWSLLARGAAKVLDMASTLLGSSSIEPAADSSDLSQSIEIISFILNRIREEAPSGARIILAHQGPQGLQGTQSLQGTQNLQDPTLSRSSTAFCSFAHVCVDLDDVLADPSHFLPDGHWNASGHAAVARALLRVIQN